MNMNRLINMVVRQVMNRGIGKGMQMLSKGGGQADKPAPGAGQGKQLQQGLRLLRRFMR
ncbi:MULTISPECIES: hypothetical protein [Yoonia]|jgi:hypothetical protein|uniref:Uncharacterized protein n=1 Tax=Yoonia vestfoldensis SKA53 TaxID=314232 RepID=A3V6H1_9RHOB|nr:hypothetical protein [Yoonia vestfoldensis]EAQ06495.1 hypothetical protein SKA53_05388 [Yoonia vestfoldensis SKA53]